MYSKEKKEVALKVYHQTTSVSETIRILGYPTRRQLYSWISTDNSACEGVFGRLKNEMFYNTDWTGKSISDFIAILNEYLIWYNESRIKKTLGYKSPMEYRRSLGLAC